MEASMNKYLNAIGYATLIFINFNFVYAAKPTPITTYEIGLPGPAGGIVFYIFDGGGQRYSGQHGLEAAPADTGQAGWGCNGTMILGARELTIGRGDENTLSIIESCPETTNAAYIAKSYTLNGFSDWFLPSIHELNLMHKNLHTKGIGNFTFLFYWSSSEDGSNYAWYQNFLGGDYSNYSKGATYGVRAIRAF